MTGPILWALLAIFIVGAGILLRWRQGIGLDLVILATASIVANILALSLVGMLAPGPLASAYILEIVCLGIVLHKRGSLNLNASKILMHIRSLFSKWNNISLLSAIMISSLILVLGLFLNNFLFQIEWRPVNADSMSYHVPRAYFWVEQAHVGNLPVDDFRWNEFPPNSSILIAWTILAGSFPAWAPLPQVCGLLLLCFALWRITRQMEFSLAGSVLSVLLIFSFPAIYVQLNTAGNELLVAGLIAAMASYLIALAKDYRDFGTAGHLNLACFAACVGLGCGVKHTFLLAAPCALAGAAIVLWSARKHLKERMRRNVTQLVMASTIIIALGSWGYAINFISHGTPFYSKDFAALLEKQASTDLSLADVSFLSFYQISTFHGFEELAPWLLEVRYSFFEKLSGIFGVTLSELQPIIHNAGFLAPSYRYASAGYGITGFLSTIAIVGFAITFIFRSVIGRKTRDIIYSLMAVGALIWIALFLVSKEWTESHPRYFITILPIGLVFIAGLLNHTQRWFRWLFSLFLVTYTAHIALWMTTLSPAHKEAAFYKSQGMRSIDIYQSGDLGRAIAAFNRGAPRDEVISIYGKIDSWVYGTLLYTEGLKFRLASQNEDPFIIQTPALIERFGGPNPMSYPLPRWSEPPRIWFVNKDIPDFVAGNLEAYQIGFSDPKTLLLGQRAITAVSGFSRQYSRISDQIEFTLPTFLLDGPLLFSISMYAQQDLTKLIQDVNCKGLSSDWLISASAENFYELQVIMKEIDIARTATQCTVSLKDTLPIRVDGRYDGQISMVPPATLKQP